MTDPNGVSKRVTCKRPRLNERFRELLESLYRDAVKSRSSIAPALKVAISSLEKYPLPLKSGAECAILKGFDPKLCSFIDSQLSGPAGKIKKSKLSGNIPPIAEVGRSPPLVDKHIITEMTSNNKKNRPKNKCLETNTEKCSFVSKFGDSNHNCNDENIPIVDLTNNNNKVSKENNNIPATDSHDENSEAEYLRNYYVSRAKKDLVSESVQGNEEIKDGMNNIDLSFCENWESFPDSEQILSKHKELQTVFLPIEVCEQGEHDSASSDISVTEINLSSDDESIGAPEISLTNQNVSIEAPPYYLKKFSGIGEGLQCVYCPGPSTSSDLESQYESGMKRNTEDLKHVPPSSYDGNINYPINEQFKCAHKSDVTQCKQCKLVLFPRDSFQPSYEQKAKKDVEEIGRCILPRKMHKPAYRSGAYAILVALLEQHNECPYRDCLTKDELIQKAQKHTDQSFTLPKLDSNYTAWTNVKRLINKGMIQIDNFANNSEDFYMLTALGKAVAMELVKGTTPEVTVNDVIFHGQWNDRVPSVENVVLGPPSPIASIDEEHSSVFIEMPPGTFDIVMLIDKRENFDKNISASPKNYCRYEFRSLTIGDFLWVARSKKTGQELVLPYIVERKSTEDLANSIKDGRFHEQKFRLRKCGLKNVIYLVEHCKKMAHYGLPESSLKQAVINTSILDEFIIVRTGAIYSTAMFLGALSDKLVHLYLPECLRGCNMDTRGKELMTFEFFNKFSSKTKPLTVRDTFIKMLLQLKGLSVEKALAIADKYSTPRLLIKAYEKCTEKEGELLLANLKVNNFNRNVGPTVSKTIYKLFSKLQ